MMFAGNKIKLSKWLNFTPFYWGHKSSRKSSKCSQTPSNLQAEPELALAPRSANTQYVPESN